MSSTVSPSRRAARDDARALIGQVRQAVGAVADPELPVLTLAMLGMIHDVRAAAGEVEVELLPTFAGCPATDVIGADVEAAALAVDGVDRVSVRWRFAPAWTPDRISREGHDRLREFGIAPPTGGRPVSDVVAGRRQLPLLAAAPDPATSDPRPCPYCGSDATARDSAFGPTPCRDVRYCHACQQPFEAFKQL